MAGVIFAELHMLSGERQEGSDLVGVASSPLLALFKRRRGQLFTIVEPSLANAEASCRRVIETIEDEYFRNPSRSVTTSLRQALAVANERLRSENSKAPPNRQLRVGISCAAVREGEVYVAQVAPANAFVLHSGSVRRVFSTYSVVPETSGNGSNRASDSLGSRLDPQINFAYSPLREGDQVVLASGAYWKIVPTRYILESARHADPEMAASELYRCYAGHASRPSTSVIVIRVADLSPRSRTDWNGSNGNGRNVDVPPALTEPLDPEIEPLDYGSRGGETRARGPAGRRRNEPSTVVESASPPSGLVRDPRPRAQTASKASRTGQKGKASVAAVRALWDRLRPRWPREAVPPLLYPPGPPLQPVGNPSVALRGRVPRARGERNRGLEQSVKLALLAALVGLLAFLGNSALNAWQSWQLADAAALVQQAQDKRATAAATTDDPPAARALLAETGALLDRALRTNDDPSTRTMAAAVQSDIDRIDQTVRISQAIPLVDFSSVVDQKGEVTRLVIDGNNLYVLDDGLNRIYKYLLTPDGRALQEPGKHPVLVRQGDKVDGTAVGSLLSLAWMPAGQLRATPALFALESGRSIIAYDPKVGITHTEVAENQRWGTIQAINGFAGGLYLLDTKLKAVFYYPPTKNGYESQPYTIIDARARVDLSKAVDLALDGNLYVLEGGGAVRRFNREGRSLDFAGDLPDGLPKGPESLFASANTRSLYLVDSADERVIQYSPEGKLQRQFKADGTAVSFKDLQDVFVDEAGRKMYVLARKSLFLFDLPPLQ